MYLYQAVEEKLYHENIGEYTSYGIKVTCEIEIGFISDVSTDEEEVQRLVASFNEKQLSPIRLHDAVEDFLADGAKATV